MQAVVPAAGEATRMRPLTADRPKALVAVDGIPILTRCFQTLTQLPVHEFVVVVGYRGDQIVDAYGDAFNGVPITYVRQSDRQGLAHAVRLAEPSLDGPFIVMNGDNVFEANLDEVVAHHRATAADATLLVESVTAAEAAETGVFELDDSGNPIGMVEKPADPPSTLATAGFFVFSPRILHACHLVTPSDRGEYELPDAIDLLYHAGRVVETVHIDGWRVNLNTPADIDRAERRLAE